MLEVIVYSTAVCPYCINAKHLLASKDISYKEVFVDRDSDMLAEMLTRSNGRRTVPQIFIGDRHIGGFDDLKALNESGELDRILMS